MCFESKKDFIVGLLMWSPLYVVAIATISAPGLFIDFIILGLLILIGWIWIGTKYCIEKGTLKITCGPYKEKIIIRNIRSIRKTKNVMSGAALSVDRLEILYGKDGRTYISPKDTELFIEEIKKENRSVHVLSK